MILIAALVLYLAILAATCAYALYRGGRSERQAAVALLIAVFATQVANAMGPGWMGIDFGVMAVDVALFAAFTAIAYRSGRFWPIWIAAAQLIGVITHFAVVVHPNIVTELYRMAQPFWVFPILAGIAWGTWTHRMRRSRSG